MTQFSITPVPAPSPAASGRSPALVWTLAGSIAVAGILLPAFWNGFPLLFPDTGGYLARPFEGTLALGRSAFYGVFLAVGVPFFFWLNIAVQAAIVVWAIALTLRSHGLGGRPLLLLAVAGVLIAVTAMPWAAATLIPDILLPAAVLALHLLSMRRAPLSRLERFGLAAVIAAAIASHMGTLAVCLGVAVCLVLLPLIPLRPFDRLPRPRVALPAMALLAGIVLALASNFAITGKMAFTPGGSSFVFGRLVQDGLIARYLDERCPDPAIRLCAYRKNLPDSADDWLWAPGTPLTELGGYDGYADESRRIILDTIRMYPAAHIAAAVGSTLEQLAKLKTDVALVPEWMTPATEWLDEMEPQMTPAIRAARQQSAPFTGLIGALNWVHVPVAVASLLALAGLLLLARSRGIAPDLLTLAAVVLMSVLINAVVCGTFSNPVDRYESRLIWLAPLAMMIVALRRRQLGSPQLGAQRDLA